MRLASFNHFRDCLPFRVCGGECDDPFFLLRCLSFPYMFYMLVLRQLNTLQIHQWMGCRLRIFKMEVLKTKDITKWSQGCRACRPWTRPWVQSPSIGGGTVQIWYCQIYYSLLKRSVVIKHIFFYFPSKPTLRYKIVLRRKVGRGGGKSRKLPKCLSTEEINI